MNNELAVYHDRKTEVVWYSSFHPSHLCSHPRSRNATWVRYTDRCRIGTGPPHTKCDLIKSLTNHYRCLTLKCPVTAPMQITAWQLT